MYISSTAVTVAVIVAAHQDAWTDVVNHALRHLQRCVKRFKATNAARRLNSSAPPLYIFPSLHDRRRPVVQWSCLADGRPSPTFRHLPHPESPASVPSSTPDNILAAPSPHPAVRNPVGQDRRLSNTIAATIATPLRTDLAPDPTSRLLLPATDRHHRLQLKFQRPPRLLELPSIPSSNG